MQCSYGSCLLQPFLLEPTEHDRRTNWPKPFLELFHHFFFLSAMDPERDWWEIKHCLVHEVWPRLKLRTDWYRTTQQHLAQLLARELDLESTSSLTPFKQELTRTWAEADIRQGSVLKMFCRCFLCAFTRMLSVWGRISMRGFGQTGG